MKFFFIMILSIFISSCSILPNDLRGSYWYGDIMVTRSGYNPAADKSEFLQIWMYEHGAVEVRGLSDFNAPNVKGEWKKVGDNIIITGEYSAGNAVYTNAKAEFQMAFLKDGETLTLVEDFSFAKKYEKSETYAVENVPLESTYKYKMAVAPLHQGLFFKDIEDTLWYSEVLIAAPEFDDDYSYTKDRGVGKLLLEVYFYKKFGANDTKLKVKVTTASANWIDPANPEKEYPLGSVIYYPWVREGDWDPRPLIGSNTLWMTVKVAGEITLTGNVNSISSFGSQTEWAVKKDDAIFKIETIIPANPTGIVKDFVLVNDILLKKDLNYQNSEHKFK